MLTFIKADFAKALLGKISNDNKTTILGIIAAALISTKLDWGLLFKGDSAQLGTAAGAVVTALVCFYMNRPDKKQSNSGA